jgi:hypothetical protein
MKAHAAISFLSVYLSILYCKNNQCLIFTCDPHAGKAPVSFLSARLIATTDAFEVRRWLNWLILEPVSFLTAISHYYLILTSTW